METPLPAVPLPMVLPVPEPEVAAVPLPELAPVPEDVLPLPIEPSQPARSAAPKSTVRVQVFIAVTSSPGGVNGPKKTDPKIGGAGAAQQPTYLQ